MSDSWEDADDEDDTLTHHGNEEETNDNAKYDGENNPFSVLTDLDQRSDPASKEIHEEEAPQHYIVESPPAPPGRNCVAPVSTLSPAADTPKSPVSEWSSDSYDNDSDESDSDSEILRIDPTTPALKLRQERHKLVKRFKDELDVVLENGVEQVTTGMYGDVIIRAGRELTVTQIVRALREHTSKIARIKQDRLTILSMYNNLGEAYEKLWQQTSNLAGGDGTLKSFEKLWESAEESRLDVEYLSKQLDDAHNSLESKIAEYDQQQDELRYYQGELDNTRMELQTLQRQTEITATRRDTLLEELDSLEGEELITRRADLLAALISVRDELKVLKKQADFRETERAMLQDELLDVKEGLAEARQTNEGRGENEHLLLAELEDTKRLLADAERRERAAIERNKLLDELAKDTTANIEAFGTRVETMEAELVEIKTKLAESEHKEAEALKANETLQEVLDETSRKLAETSDQLEEVTEMLETERREEEEELENFADQVETMRLISQGGMV